MTETGTITRNDWILFLLTIAFVIFLAIAVFIILTGPDGHIPPFPWS